LVQGWANIECWVNIRQCVSDYVPISGGFRPPMSFRPTYVGMLLDQYYKTVSHLDNEQERVCYFSCFIMLMSSDRHYCRLCAVWHLV